ncbi:unnamed protein product [Tuber melanosporum]|uniref:(Perigord truffle) hypothetical protein n=1 Tax=Tuber melanosporum (strain Mel28) TaxID=656061 RepID=D5G4S5_TUBMM|nr:uncharacterized protein GSTUM_00000079001 [Tuber melanosporum]CAZ79511.1 unnamed protein product [Tuber melanosporum]
MIRKTRISSHQQNKSQKQERPSPPQRAMQDSTQLYREVSTLLT